MNRTAKALLAAAGTAAAGFAGFVAANLYRNKTEEPEFITEDDEESLEEEDKTKNSRILDDMDTPDDWDDLFETPDKSVCPEDIDLKAECPVFGDEKKLLPGEKKFIDEFVDGMQAITTIMNNNIYSIDRLARTSNMPCKIKCERIQELCNEAHDQCDLISGAANEVLKVLRKEYSWEYIDFINEKIQKMEETDYEL